MKGVGWMVEAGVGVETIVGKGRGRVGGMILGLR